MNQGSSKKLYVGSLPYSTTEDELRSLFESFGPVESARVIADKFTGQSKGFGFVEMANASDAEKAIEGMNGQPHGGRNLIVNEARPEQRREGGGSFSRGGGDRGGWGNGGGAGDRPRRPRREY